MSTLLSMSNRLKAMTPEVIGKALLGIVKDTESQAIDLNTAQLFKGLDVDGRPLRPYRSKAYADFKRSLNPAGVTDLKVTGDFYRGFFAETDRFPIFFDSRDYKTPILLELYPDTVFFGLSVKYKGVYADEIKPEVQAYYRRGILHV